MNWVADENVDRPIIDRLRRDGREVVAIVQVRQGVPDNEVISAANLDQAVLLTHDKDFGELVFRQKRIVAGVVLIRLTGLSADAKADWVARAISDHEKDLIGAFMVIGPAGVRIRRM